MRQEGHCTILKFINICRENSTVSELTPGGAGQRCGAAVADVPDPARASAQQVPSFLAIVTSKHCRHRRHRKQFAVTRPQVIADSHPYARWSHQRLTAERWNMYSILKTQ